ncbi:kinase-like protein [Trametes gibbosa]|nr:kinase-like protein [Trametes gibbosa]
MSHALLLRLFLSPSFFSVHVALQYLKIYADNIGITYYLTRRLRELDTQDLREVWGFICHLLVTRPSRSKALESFVIEICHKSTHIAMLTLWYMQAYLKDLSQPRSNPVSFLICQRVLHECHGIIFGDIPGHSTPYSSLSLPSQLRHFRRKVRPHLEPALVGIGMVWAGGPGMPQLTGIMGPVAIEQGRVDDQGQDIKSIERADGDSIVRTVSIQSTAESLGEDEESVNSPDSSSEGPSGESPRRGNASRSSAVPARMSRRQTIAAQTSPALPLHLRDIKRSRLSEDPFGQEDAPPVPSSSAASPFQSTPSFPSRHPYRPSSMPTAELLLQKYDSGSQMHMLRSHYCSSEVQFILALENICNKLLVVPKPARISALRAELTGLNHMLPAEVCMPMWCTSSDTTQPPHHIPQPHHRIVRIPPGESVVLNSAERAPYLLLVEILHNDLDFDPGKRSNKEILKKIVSKEHVSKGASRDLVSFTRSESHPKPTLIIPDHVNGSEVALGTDGEHTEEPSSEPPVVSPSVISPSPAEEEEIDLVEQLYGTESSLRANEMDLSDSIVLPPPPKNKELDMATWSRTSSNPQTPFLDKYDPFGAPHTPSLSLSIPPPPQPVPSIPSAPSHQQSQGTVPTTRVLSLDEYSERMRTAAVMLAQLNASLMREPVTAVAGPGMPPPSQELSVLVAPLRWLPGTSWLTGAVANGTPQTPIPGSSAELGAAAPMRMKLQMSEAAAIRDRIMEEMLALEEERMARMRENGLNESSLQISNMNGDMKTAEDEGIIRRELSKADPSAVVFSESWAAKKARVRQASPYGHLANWDCVSVIVKTGGDLRQEQLAVQLIQEFEKIWKDENCQCWVRYFRILITGNSSGLVETITDAVSIHSIKKAEYARRLAEERFGNVTLLDHFKTTYGDPSSAKFARAQRNFAKSLAGCSLVTYLLQIKDRHNGNILLDRDGHLIHIDFGFMLANSPGNIGFEAAPFKLPFEYVEVLGGLDSPAYREFRKLFHEGFDAARKHCDRIVTLVELMQKDSGLPCFAAFGEQTASLLRDRFQQGLTQSAVEEHVQRLIDASLGSNWTRLYDSFQYYSQSIL